MYSLHIFDPEANRIQRSIRAHFHDLFIIDTNPPVQPKTLIHPDTIYMINMQQGGLELAMQIDQPATILLGETLNDAIEAYQAKHCFFIYRSLLDQYLIDGISKALACLEQLRTHLPILHKNGYELISLASITYLERSGRMTYIHTSSQCFETYQKLANLQPYLSSSFVQCHHSFIVHSCYIASFQRTQIKLTDGTTLPISRSYAKTTKDSLHALIHI